MIQTCFLGHRSGKSASITRTTKAPLLSTLPVFHTRTAEHSHIAQSPSEIMLSIKRVCGERRLLNHLFSLSVGRWL